MKTFVYKATIGEKDLRGGTYVRRGEISLEDNSTLKEAQEEAKRILEAYCKKIREQPKVDNNAWIIGKVEVGLLSDPTKLETLGKEGW